MTNPFDTHNPGLSSPASKIVPVTPNDESDLPDGTCRALLVGSAGAATIIDASGAVRTDVPLQQGYNPIGVTRINSTGTEASNIWAVY